MLHHFFQIKRNGADIFYIKSAFNNLAEFTDNTCTGISFLLRLEVSVLQLCERQTSAHVFSYEFCEVCNNILLWKICHQLIWSPFPHLKTTYCVCLQKEYLFNEIDYIKVWWFLCEHIFFLFHFNYINSCKWYITWLYPH